ncbi:MAG: radical SAM protein [Thermoprotei archaeon]|nr:MAG: radical SAM protein [Thermoprotei archaeon]RLF00953.1 MAG: radical SAM protein [Thermoprotei archaeon]HDI75404.1 radical SAM protein [Thermoprotei archaeon]
MLAVIIDGYTDEPAGLGVPPYLDVYPRYTAGAIWTLYPDATVKYFTVDIARKNLDALQKICSKATLLIIVAGVCVPGKYLGGDPIRLDELIKWSSILGAKIKILGGPVARFGYGSEGGKIAIEPKFFENYYDIVVRGDVEIVVRDLILEKFSVEKIDPFAQRVDYSEIREFAIRGAAIASQHPCFGKNLICEIETYRGCPRYVVGGCSFCTTVRYGRVVYRNVEDIVAEVKALHDIGVRHFRIGRQADFYTYMAVDTGKTEFPKPSPQAIERLLRGIRVNAPMIETLHIDNVNPGTVYHHEKESIEITRIIMKYHTPGDVAAFGIETADPRVVKLNNLKVMPEEAFEAIKILNKVGRVRGLNGLPEILPGVNFVLGLIGETKETYYLNLEFLRRVLREGLLLRRINIRQVLAFPNTPMWKIGNRIIRKHRKYFQWFKSKVRREIDQPMLMKLVPLGTVLRKAFTESYYGKATYARQPGTYPLLLYCPERLPLHRYMDFAVVGYGYRSVTVVPYPLDVNRAPPVLLELVPGISRKKAFEIKLKRPFKSLKEVREIVGSEEPLKYLSLGDSSEA